MLAFLAVVHLVFRLGAEESTFALHFAVIGNGFFYVATSEILVLLCNRFSALAEL